MTVTYTLTQTGDFRIHYQATTDRATPVNLTNHSYFNSLEAAPWRIRCSKCLPAGIRPPTRG